MRAPPPPLLTITVCEASGGEEAGVRPVSAGGLRIVVATLHAELSGIRVLVTALGAKHIYLSFTLWGA